MPRHTTPRRILTTILSVLLLIAAVPAGALVLSRNGDFEAGFAEWTRVDQPGSSGGWFELTDAAAPITGIPLPPPPGSGTAAVADFFGPGTLVLSQSFDVPPS